MANSTAEQSGQEIDPIEYVAMRMGQGLTNKQIGLELVEAGMDPKRATELITALAEAKAKAMRSSGIRLALWGLLWCGGGIAITVATLNAAKNGGSYVVAWGAILFGGIEIIQGLVRASTATAELSALRNG